MTTIYPSPSQPVPAVRRILDDEYTGIDAMTPVPTLGYWRGDFVRCATTHWAVTGDGSATELELKAELYDLLADAEFADDDLETYPWNPTPTKVAALIDVMRAETNRYIPDLLDPPFWIIPRDIDHPATEYVSLANGLLHLPTRKLTRHTPRLFTTWTLPFEYDQDANCPTWMSFLDDIFAHDPAGADLLQEYLGVVISGRMDLQKALLIVGPPRAGKGIITRTATKLMGAANVATPTLRTLGSEYGLSTLIGKPLAIVSDLRADDGRNANAITESILNITGQDGVTANRKYKSAWTGTLPSRLIMCSNEIPRFLDASGAVATRFVSLRLSKSFLGEEDRTLERRIATELPGIYAWALDGLDRITATGNFSVPATMAEVSAQLTAHASPITEFLEDNCTITGTTEDWIDRRKLYAAYQWWCTENGHHSANMTTFTNRLTAADASITPVNKRFDDGSRLRTISGLTLRARNTALHPVAPTQSPDAA